MTNRSSNPDYPSKPGYPSRPGNVSGRPVGPVSRRRFLQSLGAVGAVTAGGGALFAASRSNADEAPPNALGVELSDRSGGALTEDAAGPTGRLLPGAVENRVLVIVDLQGGNDGLSTLVPAGAGRYYDLRPSLAVPDDEVLALDDEVGLHPSLERLHRRGITTVEGVGPVDGDLSHFAMTERWERGDVTGEHNVRTGFLGRLTDAVDDGSPLVGASLRGPTAHLITNRAATMALTGPDDLWYLKPDDWSEVMAFQEGLQRFGPFPDNDLSQRVVDSYADLSALATDLGADDESNEIDWDDPMISDGGQLGQNLHFAADLIAADVGLRVVYAADGDYDTHQNHQWRQADNLSRLDAAVDGFLDRADDLGFADRVLVATISEFGRRVPENDSGLDHGSASTMLLAGPVGNRRLGQRPDIEDLDEDDNLRVSIGFDRYLGGLAQDWLGVEAASVLPGETEPLAIL